MTSHAVTKNFSEQARACGTHARTPRHLVATSKLQFLDHVSRHPRSLEAMVILSISCEKVELQWMQTMLTTLPKNAST